MTFVCSSNSLLLGPCLLVSPTVIESVIPTIYLLFYNTYRVSASLIEPRQIWGGWGTLVQTGRRH